MTAIWDKNGYVCIPVAQEHIDQSMERNSSHCMTAMAIAEAVPDARHIAVDLQTIRFTRKGLRYVFLTPRNCQDQIIAFDQGEREKIVPFRLRMRPAQITKAARRRHECPDNAELRGSGLTVAKDQPYMTASTSQRFTPTGERNLDPDRTDGPPPLPPPRPKRRAARAKVSAARKGSIPTTLGGKPPPVSVLARREFGLRVLRK